MNLKSFITGLSVVICGIFLISSTSFASDDTFFKKDDRYYLSMQLQSSVDDAQTVAEEIIGSRYKSVGLLSLKTVHYETGTNGCIMFLTSPEYAWLKQTEQQCNDWLSERMPQLIPQGTPASSVPDICADYVADIITYDDNAVYDAELLHSYQNALPGFLNGLGVCTTYAYAFNAMVSFVPVDPETMSVDYSMQQPGHIHTSLIYNEDHAWSAVLTADGWYFYDVCFFDASRNRTYLNCPGRVWADGHHDSYTIVSEYQSSEND